jgi:hypothetical protein
MRPSPHPVPAACCRTARPTQVLLQELDQTEPRNVRAVLWGFARLGLQHPEAQRPSAMFMEAVCENLLWTIDQYDNQVGE